ncbi:uncharacterized protein UTRI_02986 [Ustilago trichophora]|uniref:Mig1 protein n=1 Tax=Ustilago trichophora TaxID=86804 RepID=A0A5C3EST3_9BASI|nr:uncharacterized protein UTRI_02986 [Ustilago trichophora]
MQVLKAVPVFLLLGAIYAGPSKTQCLADNLEFSKGWKDVMEHYSVTICYSGRDHVENKDDGFYTFLFEVQCGGAQIHCFGLGKTNTWVGYAGGEPDHFVVHYNKPDLCHKSQASRDAKVVQVQCTEKP